MAGQTDRLADILVDRTIIIGADGKLQVDSGTPASAASISSQSGNGAGMVTPPGNWVVSITVAANTQAIATRAAGAAGVRHVATFADGKVTNEAAAALAAVAFQLLDGASAIIGERLVMPAVNGNYVAGPFAPINLPGTAATSMTAQFNGVFGASTFESATLMGYDVS